MNSTNTSSITKYADRLKDRQYPALLNALKVAQDRAQEKPTVANIRAMEKIRQDVEAYEAAHMAKPEARRFATITAVHAWLEDSGWKCAFSTVANHVKARKLIKDSDAGFQVADVIRYAETFLKRADAPDETPEDLEKRKKLAETRKADAQAAHWELRTALETGAVVPLEKVESDAAAKAALLKSDIENSIPRLAPKLVITSGGDNKRIPDVVEDLLAWSEGFLHRYAEKKEWRIDEEI